MAPRRTAGKKGDGAAKSSASAKPTADQIAALRREAKKTATELEKRLGKEGLEARLLEGLQGKGREATAEWWDQFETEVAEEIRQDKRRS